MPKVESVNTILDTSLDNSSSVGRLSKYRFLTPFLLFFILVPMAFVTMMLLVATTTSQQNSAHKTKYPIYAARPHVLGESTANVASENARAATIDKVFEKWKCPLVGTGEIFVKYADANDIPYWLVAAVAFQETSCGKNIPEKDGVSSNNLWGWGVYGNNLKMFDDMEHGVKVVSQYMSERFYQQGVTELCDIMKIYTPPSSGSWCEGVEFFKDEITEYETP